MPTLAAYADRVLEERISPTKAKATQAVYSASIKALGGYFGARNVEGREIRAARLDEITPVRFRAYRAWRKSHRRSTHGEPKPISHAPSPIGEQ